MNGPNWTADIHIGENGMLADADKAKSLCRVALQALYPGIQCEAEQHRRGIRTSSMSPRNDALRMSRATLDAVPAKMRVFMMSPRTSSSGDRKNGCCSVNSCRQKHDACGGDEQAPNLANGHPCQDDAVAPPVNFKADLPAEEKFGRVKPLLPDLLVDDDSRRGVDEPGRVFESSQHNVPTRADHHGGRSERAVNDANVLQGNKTTGLLAPAHQRSSADTSKADIQFPPPIS
jgi:hypothetical protein